MIQLLLHIVVDREHLSDVTLLLNLLDVHHFLAHERPVYDVEVKVKNLHLDHPIKVRKVMHNLNPIMLTNGSAEHARVGLNVKE